MGRLDPIVDHIANVNDAIRLIAMVNQTQRFDVERLPSFIDIDSSALAGQLVEVVRFVEDDFVVNLERESPRAETLSVTRTISSPLPYSGLTSCRCQCS